MPLARCPLTPLAAATQRTRAGRVLERRRRHPPRALPSGRFSSVFPWIFRFGVLDDVPASYEPTGPPACRSLTIWQTASAAFQSVMRRGRCMCCWVLPLRTPVAFTWASGIALLDSSARWRARRAANDLYTSPNHVSHGRRGWDDFADMADQPSCRSARSLLVTTSRSLSGPFARIESRGTGSGQHARSRREPRAAEVSDQRGESVELATPP